MPTLSGFHPYKGDFRIDACSIKASTAVAIGAPLVADNAGTTGDLTVAATDGFILGVYCDKPIVSTDSDYASIKYGKSYYPVQHDSKQLWKARVSSGTAAAATEQWDYADLVSGGLTLTLTDTNKDFRITKVLDGTASNGIVVGYFASYTTEPSA